jgi:Fe-S oxidoreductase
MYPRPRDLHHTLLLTPDSEISGTVFYFPGCGSERMQADIALGVIFLLLKTGLRVVLPPPYLCCGFPARANARMDLNNRQELRNAIIFNQIRAMFGYLDFDGCVVSCGTCREGLNRINAADIFDAPVTDAAAFVLDRGLDLTIAGKCFYHQPCHDSLDGKGEDLLRRMAPEGVVSTPCCCSEAGTLALSRPDIAAAMLGRKRSALEPYLSGITGPHHLLTNCPACLNGLNRQRLAPARHLTTALADAWGDENWRQWTSEKLGHGELIRF